MSKEQQVKNSFIYVLPVVVGNGLALIAIPILTRILTKEDYGALALAQVYGLFATGLANVGLLPVYERGFFQYPEKRQAAALLYSTLAFVVGVSALLGFISFLFQRTFAQWFIGSSVYAPLIFWAFCASAMINIKLYYLAFFKNIENATSFVWYTIDENLIGFLLSILFVAVLKVGAVGVLWGQCAASVLIFALLSKKFLAAYPFVFDREILLRSLKSSYPLTVKTLFGIVGNQSDKYMIGLIHSTGGVGVYSIAQKLANVIFVYMTAIQNVFAPQIYKKMFDMGDRGHKAVGQYLTPFLYLSLLLALFVALFAEEVLIIVTPPAYHSAIAIVMVLALYHALLFFSKVTSSQLIFREKNHLISVTTATSIGLNLAFNIPLIFKMGAIGAAWGTLAAGMISGAIAFWLAQRHYRIEWEYRKIIAICSLLFASVITVFVMRYERLDYPVRLVVKAVMVSLYLYLGVRIRVITGENLRLVRSVLTRIASNNK